MTQKTIRRLLVIAGVLLMVVSVVADLVGIGDRIGFGSMQIAGVISGLAAALAGVWFARGKPGQKK